MATVPLLQDGELALQARAVFDDVRATRGSDFVNNFRSAPAHDPAVLSATWERLKVVMGPGSLDPLVKELIDIAISVSNGCEYCARSHSAAARTKGMKPDQYGELLSVIAMAAQTNALATALQLPVASVFNLEDRP